MRRLLLAALAAALVAPASAIAGDPVMALGDVQPGARCTALTVVRGTAITSFDVEVLDVIDRARPQAAQILVRVSGPAVDATGIGPGFSGSPIYCPDGAGVARNIGAISGGIGQYGGTVGLATPIEAILSEPIQPPSSALRSVVRPRVVGSRSLAVPLTLSGVSPSVAALFARAARKAGRTLLTSGAAPRAAGHPPQPMLPGAAASVALTSGDIGFGAIGTVAYEHAGSVWMFGHSLDTEGRRALFLQDAFIHAVINNPLGASDLSTYKLGSAGNDIGSVLGDGRHAVTGQIGTPPPQYPFKVFARDLDTKRTRSVITRIADEGAVGRPTGPSILGIAGSAAVAEAAAGVLSGTPARQTGEMCLNITLRELRRPIRLCQRYAVDGGGPNALAGALAGDVAAAAALIDEYRFGVLRPTNVEVGLRLRRGLRQAYIVGVEGPRRARRGRKVTLKLALRRTTTGARFTRTIRVRIPRDIRPGTRTIKLEGTDADPGSDPNEESDLTFLFEGDPEEQVIPESAEEVRDAIEELERYDGVTATIGGTDIKAHRDGDLRISGEAALTLRVRR
jgi:hypothetical protein